MVITMTNNNDVLSPDPTLCASCNLTHLKTLGPLSILFFGELYSADAFAAINMAYSRVWLAVCSSIQSRDGASPDQTVGMLGLKQSDRHHARTATTIGSPFSWTTTARPPLSALQTFPPPGNISVHMQVELSGFPGSKTP